MRYISDDGKVFNTEQECCEHEYKIEQERVREEKIEMERQNRLDSINKKYEDLQKEISEYKKDYGARLEGYFTPFHELLDILYR
jgi:hypothetical protein